MDQHGSRQVHGDRQEAPTRLQAFWFSPMRMHGNDQDKQPDSIEALDFRPLASTLQISWGTNRPASRPSMFNRLKLFPAARSQLLLQQIPSKKREVKIRPPAFRLMPYDVPNPRDRSADWLPGTGRSPTGFSTSVCSVVLVTVSRTASNPSRACCLTLSANPAAVLPM